MNTIAPPPADLNYYIGIDVHKKSWTVTVLFASMELQTFSMPPSAASLHEHLRVRYPSGSYYSVYEAGFCGFGIHRQLCQLGVHNIVVHAADVPTSDKERDRKCDPRDSRKLARELRSGGLRALHIPSEQDEQLRALCRQRQRLQQHGTRLKNRIRMQLYYFGLDLPEHAPWSGRFIAELQAQFQGSSAADLTLQTLLRQLRDQRAQHSDVLRCIRKAISTGDHADTVKLLCTIPGIGFITAVTLVSELFDIQRFPRLDHLCAMVGICPSTKSSGEHTREWGLSRRKNGYLKHLVIEAAWVAVRRDPQMHASYAKLLRRMPASRAIVRSARQLLNRIRYVWKNHQPYEPQSVEVA